MPDATMRRILRTQNLEGDAKYKALAVLLTSYQRSGDMRNWDSYRDKIADEIRETLATILKECRRNGFVGPVVINGAIRFRQIRTYGNMSGDMCTLCSRECSIREMIDSGELKRIKAKDSGYNEAEKLKRCWQ